MLALISNVFASMEGYKVLRNSWLISFLETRLLTAVETKEGVQVGNGGKIGGGKK